MTAQPDSPRDYCDRLGLSIDLSREGSPAIVGSTGKRHYYSHGRRDSHSLEMCDVLARLARAKAA